MGHFSVRPHSPPWRLLTVSLVLPGFFWAPVPGPALGVSLWRSQFPLDGVHKPQSEQSSPGAQEGQRHRWLHPMGWSQGAPLGEVEGRGRARNGAAVCESGHIQGAGYGGIAELFRYKFKSLRHLKVETTTHTSQKGHHTKSTDDKGWSRCEGKGTLPHSWWECKLVQPLWGTVRRVLKKTKHRITMGSGNPTPGRISRENSNSKRYMHPNFHSSTIYSSQDLRAT